MHANVVPRQVSKYGGNNKYDIINKVFVNKKGLSYIVTDKAIVDKFHVKWYLVRFLQSNYETYAPSSQIRNGDIKDRLSPSVHGIGCLGYANRTSENIKVYDCWRAMIARCYNKSNSSYKTYGQRGCYVCERWLRFDLFLEDISKIDGYDYWQVYHGKLCLDKDIKCPDNKTYSIETCMWVSRSENTRESLQRRHHGTCKV